MEHGRMWRGLVEQFPNPTLLCPVLRFVFSLAALRGFLGNTKYCGILLVPKKSFYATSESCLCMLPLLPSERVSFRLSCRGDCVGIGGEGSGGVSVTAACPLLCATQLTHSSVRSEVLQTKMQ